MYQYTYTVGSPNIMYKISQLIGIESPSSVEQILLQSNKDMWKESTMQWEMA